MVIGYIKTMVINRSYTGVYGTCPKVARNPNAGLSVYKCTRYYVTYTRQYMCTTQGFQKSKEGFSININFNLICNTLSSNRRLIRKGKIIIELTSHQKIKNHHRIQQCTLYTTTYFKYKISLWPHLVLNSCDIP